MPGYGLSPSGRSLEGIVGVARGPRVRREGDATGTRTRRLLVGLHLLGSVGTLASARRGRQTRRVRALMCLLGVRHAAEASILLLSDPGPAALEASAAVDGLHAASMVLLAGLSPCWRIRAPASAALSSITSFLAVRAARSTPEIATESELATVHLTTG